MGVQELYVCDLWADPRPKLMERTCARSGHLRLLAKRTGSHVAGSGPGAVEHAYAEMQASDAATLLQMRARMAKEQAKGEAARHQQAIWDRLLEVRILLQKGLAASHQLPRPHAIPGVRSASPELADGLDKIHQVTLLHVPVLRKTIISATVPVWGFALL